MVLGADDKKWISKTIIKGVIDGINQVMIPYSEEQERRFKAEFRKVDDKIEDVRDDLTNQMSKVDRKLDAVTDHQAEKLDDHGIRIKKLESAVFAD